MAGASLAAGRALHGRCLESPDAVPKLALYGQTNNPFTEKCRRALVFKKLDFELHISSGPEDVKRWSPVTGLLPVMRVDGDELVSDSTNILLRLEQLSPEPPLLSSVPIVAAQQRNLEDWADESFLWYWQEWYRLEAAAPPPPAAGAFARLRRLFSGAEPPDARRRAQAELLRGLDDRLSDLVNFLGSRRFFYSDRVSIADLTVYAMLLTLRRDAMPGSAALLAARTALGDFMHRVEAETGGAQPA
jgi:glutathione S-transferase